MEPMLGQIMLFAGNFAPKGWLPCDGRLVPCEKYPALFSVIALLYGGDGITTFGLPDLRGGGRGGGPAPGGSTRPVGDQRELSTSADGGAPSVPSLAMTYCICVEGVYPQHD